MDNHTNAIATAIPAWLIVVSLTISALWVLCTALAHVPGLPPKVTAFFVRAGTFLGSFERVFQSLSAPTIPKPPTLPLVALVVVVVALLGCGGTGAQHPIRHWEVRGAVLTMRAADDAASVGCAELPQDSAHTTMCFAALDRARKQEKIAADMLGAWEDNKAPLRCAVAEWADALVDAADVFVSSGIKIPVEVEDGLAAAHVVDGLAEDGCPVSFESANDAGDSQ